MGYYSNWYPNASSHMPSKLHILKAVRYYRKCFHHSLNRSAVISGNEKLMEAIVRKPLSSYFVCFAFRLLPFRLLPFHLLSQQTKAKVHCSYIRLETNSVYEIILPLITVLIRSWVTMQSPNGMKQPQIIISFWLSQKSCKYNLFWNNLTCVFFKGLMHSPLCTK